MALSVTSVGTPLHSTTNTTAYSSSAIAWTGSRIAGCWIIGRGVGLANPSSVAGTTLTWVKVASSELNNSPEYIVLYLALTGAGSTDTLTATWGSAIAGCHIMAFEVDGADLTVATADLAAVQGVTTNGTGTSGSITLAAAGATDNRPMSAWDHLATEATTFRTDWTELDDGSFSSPVSGAEYQWRSDTFETTATASWTTSSQYIGSAIELKAAAGGTSATATPATVVGVAAVPAPATAAAATPTPATVAAVAAVPAPTVLAAARPTPATVVSIVTVPAPTTKAEARAPPATVAAIAAVPAPSVLTGGSVTVSPATVAAIAAVPAPTVLGAATVTPAAVVAAAAVPAPTVRGTAIASPATVVAIAAVPAPISVGAPGQDLASEWILGAVTSKWFVGPAPRKWHVGP